MLGMSLSKVLTRAMSTSKTTRMRNSTYPKWTGPSQCPSPVVPNPPIALPLRPPPVNHCPNALPARPPTSPPEGFVHSRHIIPAAFPRTYNESTGKLERGSEPFTKTPRSNAESSEERKERNLGEARQCARARFGATSTTGEGISNQAGLWVAGERWIRADDEPGEGLTLVLSAANGFTKEVSALYQHRSELMIRAGCLLSVGCSLQQPWPKIHSALPTCLVS